ncbi:SRPBCC family protein [Phenylobacterium kunshanense]|uniref:SRPBCC domain-containing protein n=1 Tax=Phenylobacterium kunshanense TaxID=1445034 RepID=A0A328BML7_9CAUL|nr:SRPBCC domain-containing protein [Phenylobacterium kunshanense]RAK67184.1 hypothetical protein DJ019_04390 [Phenylobacterium kunshanense]
MRTLQKTLEIDAPPREVWRVLTNPELVREWAAAYEDGLSIRTSWREGEAVVWRSPDGSTRASGAVAAFQPERLLKFDYTHALVADGCAFSESFEITAANSNTVLSMTSGPLNEAAFNALMERAEEALREIKSLAEESAQIRRGR